MPCDTVLVRGCATDDLLVSGLPAQTMQCLVVVCLHACFLSDMILARQGTLLVKLELVLPSHQQLDWMCVGASVALALRSYDIIM